jgi:DNA-binding beta-propeller fold protein YncE
MKLLNLRGDLLASIQTRSGGKPWDIAVTRDGNLVYTDHKHKTVNVVKNNKGSTLITLQGWVPAGFCCTASDDLLVTMISNNEKQSKVVRYSNSKETQTIDNDDQGRPLYSCIDYINENKNLDICVSDWDAISLVVVNASGKLRFRYTGHSANAEKSFKPAGIATNSQGHILIADFDNDCVHIIDQDGQFQCYIICDLRNPLGLSVDDRDNLFVAEWKSAKVKRIKYL